MLKILMIHSENNHFNDLAGFMKNRVKIDLSWTKSGKNALNIIAEGQFDLVVIDEILPDMTGMELVKKLVLVNPIINTAVVSELPHDEFHEVTEGLGILAQLPPNPGREHAEHLLQQLKKIMQFSES